MIRGKKKALSKALEWSGLHLALRSLAGPRLTIFNFHRIREDAQATSEFDDEVFGPTAEEFRAQIRWLKANSEVLSEEEVISVLHGRMQLPRVSTMVTFDDGYSDNYRLALPILKEAKVPAIYFIPTQAIEERTLGWWDVIAYLLKKTSRSEIVLGGRRVPVRGHPEQEREARVLLQQWMKLRPASETEGLLAELSQACGVPIPDREICGKELMTWDQVRAAATSGIAIGSHTHSHRVLATLDQESQRSELSRSKCELETRLGKPVRTLAYPVGGYEHFHRETQSLAAECGYEAAFSFHTGVNEGAKLARYDLRRISAPEDLSLYCASLALPRVFAARKCEASAPGC